MESAPRICQEMVAKGIRAVTVGAQEKDCLQPVEVSSFERLHVLYPFSTKGVCVICSWGFNNYFQGRTRLASKRRNSLSAQNRLATPPPRAKHHYVLGCIHLSAPISAALLARSPILQVLLSVQMCMLLASSCSRYNGSNVWLCGLLLMALMCAVTAVN